MDFTPEFIQENGLNNDQISAITNHIQSTYIPDVKKTLEEEYKGVANKNAEGILDGATKYAKEKLGVELEREQGEKAGDYLVRLFESKNTSIEELKSKYNDKLKNFKGDEEYKNTIEGLNSKNSDLLKKIAELEPLMGIDEKYKTQSDELQGLKLSLSFNQVKPVFSEEVNPYEAKAKWADFQKGVLEKYNIEFIDNVAYGVDKENEHKKVKLEELVSKDESIQELLKGRQQKGLGSSSKDLLEVEGLPFKVPKGASSEELSKLIREYLVGELGDAYHPEFSKKFAELHKKAKSASV